MTTKQTTITKVQVAIIWMIVFTRQTTVEGQWHASFRASRHAANIQTENTIKTNILRT